MSTNQFLTKENATLLWEVLIDNEILSNKPRDFINELRNIFYQNITPFYDYEKKFTNSLVDLNKKFIKLMIQFVNKNYGPKLQPEYQERNLNKKELIRSEDIKADRISQFDKDLESRQREFTNAMSLPVPQKPKFNDEVKDEPLGEDIEEIIRRTVAQRNYDVEHVNQKYNPTQANEWLKSNETSIKKSSPGVQNTSIVTQNNGRQNNNSIKYIRIDKDDLDENIIVNDIIDINSSNSLISPNKKQISWADQSEKEYVNIFSKLKQIPIQEVIEQPKKTIFKMEDREKKDYENQEKIKVLENKIDILQNKMDIILNLIQNNYKKDNIELEINS
jgi:hypothetical protein